jgi:hypothetical protein
MKPLVVAGVLLAIFGAFVLTRGMNFSSRRDVIRVGSVEASVQTHEAVPQWAGITCLACGALLIGAGVRGKRA